jgi:GTP-binding protein HflX
LTIVGNTQGLGTAENKLLERLARRRVPFDQMYTTELARDLVEFSRVTGRQVGVLVARSGQIDFVVVGDAAKLMLPDLGRFRAAEGRFRGVRLIHTHLRGESLSRDDLVDLTRLRLDLICAICVAPDGAPGLVYWAHCVPVIAGSKDEPFHKYGPTPSVKVEANPAALLPALEAEFARVAKARPVVAKDGRAILVHVCDKRSSSRAGVSLAELKELADTAGVEVADTVLQVRDAIDPKFVLGRGKLDDVVLRAMQLDVEVLIFDRNLSPGQITAITAVTDLKVIDRTQLILDIFAQRAESRDGKLQVELAQMKYLLPRLGQKDDALSRLTGGIGGRGPGETKLEIGRRRAKERVEHLEMQLKQLERQRKQRRQRRSKRGVPIVSIVGYTNAGKSTLLNTLTESHVLAEDKLFATLDTRSRRIRFPQEREVILTDTVGFIRDLPKDLFSAFRATFEEAQDADLILHVIDVSDPDFEQQMATTDKLLEELDLERVPRLTVYNKIDQLPFGEARYFASLTNGVLVSALDRESLGALLLRMQEMLFDDHGDVVPQLIVESEDVVDRDEEDFVF